MPKRKATPFISTRKKANFKLKGKKIGAKILTRKELRQLSSEARLKKLKALRKK